MLLARADNSKHGFIVCLLKYIKKELNIMKSWNDPKRADRHYSLAALVLKLFKRMLFFLAIAFWIKYGSRLIFGKSIMVS